MTSEQLKEAFKSLIGMNRQEASLYLETQGRRLRVARKNGQAMMVAQDLDNTRINVALESDRVIEILGLG